MIGENDDLDFLSGYTLNLYTPANLGEEFVGEVTSMAKSWSRTTRWLGGYWLGNFTVDKEAAPLSVMEDIFYNLLGGTFRERVGSETTWEGLVSEMELDDDPEEPELDVVVSGFVHTAQDDYATSMGPEGTLANISDVIAHVVANSCEFLSAGEIERNTLQVPQEVLLDRRAWDEMMRAYEMGNSQGELYRLWVGAGRRLYYQKADLNPIYFSRGGFRRRRSRLLMWNKIRAAYIDTNNQQQELAAIENTESQDVYGTRSDLLVNHDLPAGAVAARQLTYLNENAYPWPRTTTSKRGIQLFSPGNQNVAVSPWHVQPGVVRDMAYRAGSKEKGAALNDIRDALIDEVECGVDGLFLRTFFFDESSMMQTKNIIQDRSRNEPIKTRRQRLTRTIKNVRAAH